MSFEWIGRWSLRSIGLLFPITICLMPLSAAFLLQHQQSVLENLEERFLRAKKRAKGAFERKEREEKFFAYHSHSDPYFLDKEIESLRFLEKETTLFSQWVSHPALNFQTRFIPLGNEDNRLIFNEEKIQVGPACKETIETQRYPIRVNEEDLKKLLTLIEEIPPQLMNRPQLLITDFHLAPKQGLLEIQMNLLKREFP